MSIYAWITAGALRQLQSAKIFGVVIGLVSNNQDDEGLGRVKVTFPWLEEHEESHWARLAVFMAGDKRGAFFLPEVGDEVLVAFEHGDINRPYILGALWNGVDQPPETNADGKNNLRLIQSRSGHRILLDDTDGQEKIEIKDKTGKNAIVWDTAANKITVSGGQDLELQAPQGKIALTGQNVEIKSSGNTTIEASGTMTLKGATVNIN